VIHITFRAKTLRASLGRRAQNPEGITVIPDIPRKWGSVRIGHDKIRLSRSNRQWLLTCRQANTLYVT
jgi:hypothetical protein